MAQRMDSYQVMVDRALTEACLATERHEMREEQHERMRQAFVAGDDALVLRLWDVYVRASGDGKRKAKRDVHLSGLWMAWRRS